MDLSPNTNERSLRLARRVLERGFITSEQLTQALCQLALDPADQTSSRLGAILREKGYITSTQLEALLEEDQAAAAKSSSAAPLGTFGKFELQKELGRGGMGVVYEAYDKDLDRIVALKLLLLSPNADPKEAALDEERFVREAQLSAKLKHPRIVSVYEAGTIGAKRYIAMEYVEGQPLCEWRRKGSVTVRQQVSILRDTALALHDAHAQGIIHRDLKPANILIDRHHGPHITDFGLAKFVGQNVTQSFTAEGRVVGTPTYMSPEQVRGSKSLDARTDIYSMGVMLYEILTGRLPFEGESAMEIMMKSLNTDVMAPSKISGLRMNPLVFSALEGICLKAMAKEPGDRYPDARKLAGDLTLWLEGHNVRVGTRRLRPIAALLAAGAILGLAGWTAMKLLPSRPTPTVGAAAARPAPPATRPVLPLVVFDAARVADPDGLRVRVSDQHQFRSEVLAGKAAVRPLRADGSPGFLLLDVEDARAAELVTGELEIEYFDAGPAWSNFAVEYDSMDGRWAHDGTYKRAGMVVLQGTNAWRKFRCILTAPRLENRMELGADIRFATDRADILIHRVELRPWTPAPAYSGPPAAIDTARLRPGLQGDYHADIHLGDSRKKSVDADLVFNWPDSAWTGGPPDRFSIRWTGGFRAPRKGRYVLDVQSDDGVRVFLGGRAVILNWTPHAPTTDAAQVELDAGFYPLQVEYFEEGGGAYLRVAWFEEREGRMWPVDPAPFFNLAPPGK